jgi:hypothetical protein
MKPTFMRNGDLFASAWQVPGGYFAIISKHSDRIMPALLHAGLWQPHNSANTFLKKLLDETKGLDGLDPVLARTNFKAEDRDALSLHLLHAQNEQKREFESVVEEIAWRYVELISWGESSAAKVLAQQYQLSPRTIHTRLRLARERKLITSPGSGSRLEGEYEAALKKLLK